MIKICPHPRAWAALHSKLIAYSQNKLCVPSTPPIPLVLAGWEFSNDRQKLERWNETVLWSTTNGCSALLDVLSDDDFYHVREPTEHMIGPLGGPMYLIWNYEPRRRPDPPQVETYMANLERVWTQIAGHEIARVTRPVRLTGAKRRRLVVTVTPGHTAPWGDWNRLSNDQSKRRAFSRLREAVNHVVAPHEVDHIDFIVEPDARTTS